MKKLLLTILLSAAAAHAADLRLYVFDCGKLHYDDPTRFNFKKEEVKVYDLSVGCYLIVHPKGTLMWDVGVIPDSRLPQGWQARHQTLRHRHQNPQVAGSLNRPQSG